METLFLYLVDLLLFLFVAIFIRKHPTKTAFNVTVFSGVCSMMLFSHGVIKEIYKPIVSTAKYIYSLPEESHSEVKTINNNDLLVEQIYKTKTEIDGYPTGKYTFRDFPIAKDIVKQTLYNTKKFCDENNISYSNIEILIMGTADGIPTKRCYYKGDLNSNFTVEYQTNDGYEQISFKKNKTIMRNKHYAVARAYTVKLFCENYFGDNRPTINIAAHCYKEIGSEYRKIIVGILIKDAYKPYTEQMNMLSRYVFKKANAIIL